MKTTALNFCFWALVPLVFGATDSTKQNHIAVAVGNTIVKYDSGLVNRSRAHPIQYNIRAMTYDPLNDSLIGITTYEGPRHQLGSLIFRYDPKSNKVSNMAYLPIDINDIKSIAFDYLGNNLYISKKNNIAVYSFNTGGMTEFSYTENPFDMVLIPEEGIMFAVLEAPDYPYNVRIARMKMNNIDKDPPVDIKLDNTLFYASVTFLAYDKDSRRLFWASQINESIYYADSNNYIQRIFRKNITKPVDIAVLDDKIVWTSRDSSVLSWTNKHEIAINTLAHRNPTDLPPGNLFLQSIDSLYTRQMINNIKQLHPCSRNNGGCSHVCLVTDVKDKLCACPKKFYLDDSDMKNCKSINYFKSKNSSGSNRRCWIGLIVGLMAFVVYMQ